MSNETLVISALLSVIAALVLLLRSRASTQNINTDEHRLVVQLATQGISNTSRVTDLETRYAASQEKLKDSEDKSRFLLDQIEAVAKLLTSATDKSDLLEKLLNIANEKIDAQALLLVEANKQIELLNGQIASLRRELAISKQPGDTTAADAANVQHKADDAEAAAPTATTTPDASPEIDSST